MPEDERQALVDELHTFPSLYPAMRRWGLGTNRSTRDQTFTHAFSIEFEREEELLAYLGSERHERFVAEQIYYSLEARDAEYELVPVALDQGLGILVWSPLAGGLLFFLNPTAGRTDQVPPYVWIIGIGANLALVGALTAWGRKGPAGRGGGHDGSSSHQAAVFGVAGGSAFGLTAALMKGMTTHFAQGWGAIFTSWQLYALAATGALGMFLVQSALNAGRLIAAQPGLTLSDPIISILWGVLAFHEQVRAGLWPLLLAALSTVVMAGAVFALSRSPLLAEDSQDSSESGRQASDEASHASAGLTRSRRGAAGACDGG